MNSSESKLQEKEIIYSIIDFLSYESNIEIFKNTNICIYRSGIKLNYRVSSTVYLDNNLGLNILLVEGNDNNSLLFYINNLLNDSNDIYIYGTININNHDIKLLEVYENGTTSKNKKRKKNFI